MTNWGTLRQLQVWNPHNLTWDILSTYQEKEQHLLDAKLDSIPAPLQILYQVVERDGEEYYMQKLRESLIKYLLRTNYRVSQRQHIHDCWERDKEGWKTWLAYAKVDAIPQDASEFEQFILNKVLKVPTS